LIARCTSSGHSLTRPKPSTRSFSINRYGFDGAYALALQARAEFVAEVEGFIGVAPIPEPFRPGAARALCRR
jgi:hypothetical protein